MLSKNVRSHIEFRHSDDSHVTAHWIWTGTYDTIAERPKTWETPGKPGRPPTPAPQPVHVFVYESLKGPLQEDERLKQNCKFKRCINPNHWSKK